MPNAKWITTEDWKEWIGLHRIESSSARISYNRLVHVGTGGAGTAGYRWNNLTKEIDFSPAIAGQIKGLWRVGQYHSSGDNTIAVTNVMSIATDPAGATEVGQRLIHATSGSGHVHSSTTEWGIYSPTRYGYAEVTAANAASFMYPTLTLPVQRFYVGCWIKSAITDYSDNVGYIIACRDSTVVPGSFGLAYAIYVDTDNYIKAKVKSTTGTKVISSNTKIDTEWHYVLLISYGRSAGAGYLVVDNEINVSSFFTGLGATSPCQGFTIKGINYGDDGEYGFAGAVDEITVGQWTGTLDSSFSIYHFSPLTIYTPIIDTNTHDSVLAEIRTHFVTEDNSSLSFAFRGSNSLFLPSDTSPAWSGYTSAQQVLDNEPTSLYDIGSKGRYQQIRMRMNPSYETIRRKAITPEVYSVETIYETESLPLNLAKPAYNNGQLLGQTVNFTGTKSFDKISLDFTVSAKDTLHYIMGGTDTVSFQAANFSSIRYPEKITEYVGDWPSCGMTLCTNPSETSIMIDNVDAEFTTVGAWSLGSLSSVRHIGTNYAYATTFVTGLKTARWTPDLTAGYWDVYAYIQYGSNRNPRAVYSVNSATELSSSTISQIASPSYSRWTRLQTCAYFDAGSSGYIEVSNALSTPVGSEGSNYTSADAARFESRYYTSEEDILANAPSLTYTIFFSQAGEYDVWGLGFGDFMFAYDGDITNVRTMSLGGNDVPEWTWFDSFSVEAGSIHTFTVYFYKSTAAVDQWYFTLDRSLQDFLKNLSIITLPMPLSPCSYNTCVKLSSLGSSNTCMLWKPSSEIQASGQFNYEIPTGNREFVDGLIIEYRQFGGNADCCAMWNYSYADDSIGLAYRRNGFGETTEWET